MMSSVELGYYSGLLSGMLVDWQSNRNNAVGGGLPKLNVPMLVASFLSFGSFFGLAFTVNNFESFAI
jgi:hypothetical protein